MRREFLRREVSRNAGAFVCNHLYFGALHYLTEKRSAIPAVFCIRRSTPEQSPQGASERRLTPAEAANALRVAAAVMLDRWRRAKRRDSRAAHSRRRRRGDPLPRATARRGRKSPCGGERRGGEHPCRFCRGRRGYARLPPRSWTRYRRRRTRERRPDRVAVGRGLPVQAGGDRHAARSLEFLGFRLASAANDATTACIGAHAGATAGSSSPAPARRRSRACTEGKPSSAGAASRLGDDGSGAQIGLDALRCAMRAFPERPSAGERAHRRHPGQV